MLAVFEAAPTFSREAPEEAQIVGVLQYDQKVTELEGELQRTREQLHQTVEEIELAYCFWASMPAKVSTTPAGRRPGAISPAMVRG